MSLDLSLPLDLGFSKLSYLAVFDNKLTGHLPSSIGHLQDSLFEVLLLNNQLSDCLPHELGMLNKAAVIDAGMNQLTGPIPASFSCISSVEQLNLGGNRLYGQVPDVLCKLAGPAGRLANLTLAVRSVAPACAALIKDGVLDVKNNCIPGLANQRRPAECAAFQSQPKTCPAATTQVACPAAPAAAPGERNVIRDYSGYVTYATLHD
uniref:Leucine-rich repeat-containing N-terminal plant-type domain-containing protein n=1 Tax=Setaria italica TaxID=4555 RepID=K3YXU9_SETIT